MRIAQISTLHTPVTEHGADSIETLVYGLTKELVRHGQDVTVFASGDSQSPAKLNAILPGPCGQNGSPADWHLCEWINLANAVSMSEEFDVLHGHGYLWGIPLDPLSKAPFVHTLHTTPHREEFALTSLFPNSCVVATSEQQWQRHSSFSPTAVIHNGVDTEHFAFQPDASDYLCFIGRFIPQKGAVEAIQIAKRLGMKIKIAGKQNEYFEEQIAHHVDGSNVEYVGFVSGPQKSELLGNALAMLYPVEKPEPFGLVLIESMLCGTPVVASSLGAVNEIVQPGVGGYHSSGELDALVESAIRLDRAKVRRYAEENFSIAKMADKYLELYKRLVEQEQVCARS